MWLSSAHRRVADRGGAPGDGSAGEHQEGAPGDGSAGEHQEGAPGDGSAGEHQEGAIGSRSIEKERVIWNSGCSDGSLI